MESLASAQPTPTSETRTQAVETLLAEAQSLYEARQWEETGRRLETIRSLDPDFQPEVLDELLYGTYISAAQDTEANTRDEEALSFYQKALEIRPGDPIATAALARLLAYRAALEAWGLDWEETIRIFQDLHRADPTYRDVAARLAQALAASGESYRQQGSWCLAAAQFEHAMEIQPEATLQQQAAEANRRCKQPTATPRPRPQGTATPDRVPGPPEQPDVSGLSGKILFSHHDPGAGVHEVLQIPAAGGQTSLIAGLASQPDVSPDGQWLAYHSWENDRLGILAAPLDGGASHKPMRVTYLEDIQPTWGPESKRLAFASNRHGDRKWRVYLTWAEGRDDAWEIAFGESPDWSVVNSRIVYRGCGPSCEVWGLYTMNDQGGDQELLVADPSATAPAWSPDGDQIAFMSNRDGNWEIYEVQSDGLGLRRLTNEMEHDGAPTWSPDGRWIGFLSHRKGGWGIYAIPVRSTGKPELIYSLTGEFPDWMQEQMAWIE
jgi:TolB protein